MANFPPLKGYILFCLDRMIGEYGARPPFLDVGCGIGDVSLHLARRGWFGAAIDSSSSSIEASRTMLSSVGDAVAIAQQSVCDISGSYRTVIALDVIEHLEDDASAVRQMVNVLEPGGHLVIGVPSNPREWRWDDDTYGHVRRYTPEGVCTLLEGLDLEVLACWDFTFPVFWVMRRAYTRLKRPPPMVGDSMRERSEKSPSVNAWSMPVIGAILSYDSFIWRAVYRLQFRFFRNWVHAGHEMILIARKGAAAVSPSRTDVHFSISAA